MYWEKHEVVQDHKWETTSEQAGKWVSLFNRLKVVVFPSNLLNRVFDSVVIDHWRKAELTSITRSDQLRGKCSSQVLTFHSLTGCPPSCMLSLLNGSATRADPQDFQWDGDSQSADKSILSLYSGDKPCSFTPRFNATAESRSLDFFSILKHNQFIYQKISIHF